LYLRAPQRAKRTRKVFAGTAAAQSAPAAATGRAVFETFRERPRPSQTPAHYPDRGGAGGEQKAALIIDIPVRFI
jgi:hypothetical protein